MELDQKDFISLIEEGREIEICFEEKWYFFRATKRKNTTFYLFNEITNARLNDITTYCNLQELMKMRIQNCRLADVLENVEDYVIY